MKQFSSSHKLIKVTKPYMNKDGNFYSVSHVRPIFGLKVLDTETGKESFYKISETEKTRFRL